MKLRRILALAGVVILVGLYILTLVLAITKSQYSMNLFIASAVSTLVIPIILHLLFILINVKNGGSVYDNPYKYRD